MADLQRQLDMLQQVLRDALEVHQVLAELLQKKRYALRDGRADAVMGICKLENEKVQMIAELEKTRLRLLADLTRQVAPEVTQPMRLQDLAERLEEPHRGRLLVLRQQLREQMKEVRQESSVARRATESLTRHLHGLLQSITTASSGAPTYGRHGSTAEPVASMSTFNVTA